MSLLDCILDSLQDLEYPFAASLDENVNFEALNPVEYSKLISWLSSQINLTLDSKCTVNCLDDENDLRPFNIELSTLLRELESPYDATSSRLGVLNFLCGEALVSRMILAKNLNKKNKISIDMQESDTAKHLKKALTSLGIGKPPDNITASQLFGKLLQRLKDKSANQEYRIENSLFIEAGSILNDKQWQLLENFQKQLELDYTLRRQTMLTRCDCTIMSFKWKSTVIGKDAENEIDHIAGDLAHKFQPIPSVSMADALASRASDCLPLLNSIISSHHEQCTITAPQTVQANQGIQQRLSLHNYTIGDVPDRGGRPTEQPTPAKETFSQQEQRRNAPPSRRGGGRGGRDYITGHNQRGGGSAYETGHQSNRNHRRDTQPGGHNHKAQFQPYANNANGASYYQDAGGQQFYQDFGDGGSHQPQRRQERGRGRNHY
ncbi:Protein FAM98A [Halotydeus destructor]|nr:Protein FAM98A [Halotydeus destructor]